MMSKNVRILVVAVGLAVLGFGPGNAIANPTPEIRDLVADTGSSGPVLHLRASGELETVHYSPQPGVWIVEMPEASWDDAIASFSEPDIGIDRVELGHVEEFGKRHSRLTVWLEQPAQLDLATTSDGMTLRFTLLNAERWQTEATGVDERVAAEPALAELPPVATRDAGQPASIEPSPGRPPADLRSLDVIRRGEGVVIELIGNGPLEGRSFTLPSPQRLVVDLDGIVNRVDRHVFPVGSDLVRQVRVAQHQSLPDPVTRLVVDLEGEAEYQLRSTETGAVLMVGVSDVVPTAVVAEVASGTMTITNLSDDGSVGAIHTTNPSADNAVAKAGGAPASVPSEVFALPEPKANAPQQARQPASAEDVELPDRNPWVADRSQLIEEAAATEIDLPGPADSYATTEVESEEVQFTGDPISLTLKDADVKDVLKTFSALTRLNIVIDPEVNGSVTVELRDVPWDQALDLILRINSLDYVLENNVLRVSTISKLTREKNQRAAFLAQQEIAQPLKTVVKPLSYARASEVAGLLSNDSYLMSDRGAVVVDERTNQLIIRDTIDRVEGVLRLIDTLDLPTPQVVIEGRIVETTKTFSRELGINWGFTSVNDAAHGNDTGLRFPNSINTEGGVILDTARNGFLSMTFGDILNTFNLDFLLTAAESEGLAKIVSTPRVTTQNLKAASIRSGLQIPVQTVANNTVTVQYVDATLRLQVTPQITAEGTVNLDIDIRKQQPVQAGIVTGGNNAPILTRDAQTELLVRDGGTTVIGGIYQIDDEDNQNKVPGLWKIPIIGNLFRNKAVNQRHDELLIFITPRIVKY